MKDNEEFDINKFINESITNKKKFIIEESKKISPPSNIPKDLKNSYLYKEVINKFIVDFINIKKQNISDDYNQAIKNKIESFKDNYLNNVLPNKTEEEATNLYQISESFTFAKTNTVTRSLSTVMGHLWEELAICSKKAISTEKEFDLKITGVDLIILKNDKPFYCQMKTLEGTLTGSQVPRSITELSIHENAYFIAAFKTGTPWTFNSDKISRLVGKEFWSLIDIDYEKLLDEVKKMIKEIEDNFLKMKEN